MSFAWLAANGLPLPDRVFLDRESANAARRAENPKSKHLLRPEWLGVYQRIWEGGWSAIAVDTANCLMRRRVKPAVGEPFWQAPGAPQDFTPLGVLCHEVGHHVDYILHPKAYSTQNGFQKIVDNEEDVSTAEYNLLESFAEAIRLFITNPMLLAAGRPDRFEYLTKTVGLKPIHMSPWRTVLRRSGARVVTAVEAWLEL
jgi:hypothetical protein